MVNKGTFALVREEPGGLSVALMTGETPSSITDVLL